MERKKTLVLALVVLCAIGSGMIWLGSKSTIQGQVAAAQQARNSPITQRRLSLEIGLSKPFTVNAAAAGHTLEAFVRVPAKPGESQAAPISAIKLAPKMVGDKIE